MHHIAYSSRETRHLFSAALETLCQQSKARNKSLDITGMLVCDGSRYMQLIEGDADAVRVVMASIAQDERHDSIMYLADTEAAHRQFGKRSLCCIGFEDNLTASQLLDDVKLKVGDVTDPKLVASFIGFALLAKRV